MQLGRTFLPSRLAVLPSGRYLLTGFDSLNVLPQLLILNEGGEKIGSILLPKQMEDQGAAREANTVAGATAQGKLLGTMLFTSFRGRVLLWRMNSSAPVLEISGSGAVREVLAGSPQGYVLADIVPSTTNLLVHYRPSRLGADDPVPTSETVYYEVNPLDGSFMDRLKLEGDSPGTIACESQGSFFGYVTDEKGKLSRRVAK